MIRPLYIVWNETYAVHNPIIDEQHRAIVASINSLYFFIQEGWGLSALEPTLKIVKNYASFHAKTEEGLLMNTRCDIKEHISEHKIFEHEVDDAAKEAISMKDPQILLTFLRKWWLKHVQTHNKEYSQYFETLDEADRVV